MKKSLTLLLCIALLTLILSSTAFAYLDPGTGSMLIQILAASAVGIGVIWRVFVGKVKKKLKLKDKTADAAESISDDVTDGCAVANDVAREDREADAKD